MNITTLGKKKSAITYAPLPESARTTPPSKEIFEMFPGELMEEFKAFAFNKDGETLQIAAVTPELPALRAFTASRFGEAVEWFSCTEQDVVRALKACSRDFKAEIARLAGEGREVNGNIVEIVERIITYALSEKASDVHLEPTRGETVARFRMDGILQGATTFPRSLHSAIVARFKILSNLKIDEYRRPQDGRIEFEKYPDMTIRISIVPTLYGEKVALRILDDSNKTLSVAHLGFGKEHQEILRRSIEKPFGMIVTSGPTGSGKTTTLYGLLSLIKKEGVNISTLEDPVEYALSGINQIQINPRVDLTFASGLRALLRQDPDVIMVGEVRDSDTAIMAANAALTGHLVLTTMHTNDAPSAFTRLLEMRVEDFVVGSVVNLVIAQRLVRKVCSTCAHESKLDEVVRRKLEERKDISEALEMAGIDAAQLETKAFKKGKGCDTCVGMGYAGRAGIFEVLELNKEIHDAILAHTAADRIREIAEKTSYRPMVHDGVAKVLAGATTFDEVIRVTRNA